MAETEPALSSDRSSAKASSSRESGQQQKEEEAAVDEEKPAAEEPEDSQRHSLPSITIGEAFGKEVQPSLDESVPTGQPAVSSNKEHQKAATKQRQSSKAQKQQQQKQTTAAASTNNEAKKAVSTPNLLTQMMEKAKHFSGPSSSGDAEDPGRRKRSFLPFRRREEAEKQRLLRANDRDFNCSFKYADNFIKTSKYSLLTFIPYNLFQQFTRIANFYFLVLLLLQTISIISSVNYVYTLIPLSFVLICSAFKDGYDDLQRHRNDQQVNRRISYVVRNSRLQEEEWMHVKVGDIIRMENEHFIAADLLLLSSSEPHGLCYIETAELDGETNLKTRVALPETVPLGDKLKDISEFDGEIVCEPPNNRLDHFEGRLEWRGQRLALDNKNLLLRGCRLRNTRWCYGLVVFAGKDTKLMKNSGESPTKRTSLDRFLNLLILGIVLFLLAMCLICTLMTGFWEQIVGRYFRVFLPWDDIVPRIKNWSTIRLAREEQEREIAPSQVLFIAALQFFSYVILLNTVVPISLYISVEMIRLAHSKFINNDMKMYYAKTDTPARARTSTLNEELGQVQYVFSDKTGTLTQNIMLFKKCSVNGRSYGDLMTERGELVDIDEETTPGLDFSWNHWHESNFRFYDPTLLEDTKRGLKEVCEFWRLLAVCHTVMPEKRKTKTGNGLDYQAQSPDEAALTSAARNFGFVFKSRTPQSITIEVNGREEVYEMLHILDFDNVRKRMSVLVRSRSGKIKLYCKGADTMVLNRISARETSELLRSATLQHLDKFASDGLRTLCVAWKPVEAEYCQRWMERLREARLDAEHKERLVEALYEEMETDMRLLGATAIEDKLQDGVPQTIATLAAANVKIWVLTGDKTETAINIGYSCHLLTEDMREVFIIDGKDEKEVEVQLKDIKRRIQCAKMSQNVLGVSSFYVPPRTPIREMSHGGLESPPTCKSPSSKNPHPTVTFDHTTFPVQPAEEEEEGEEAVQRNVQSPPKWPSALGGPGQTVFPACENGFLHPGDQPQQQQQQTPPEDEEEGGDGGYALVINGEALVHALKRKYEKTFLEIGCNCLSVICCRVTPLQKAQVVDLVKRNIKAVTLAIGDGANDVSMIRTAHIGVGISGQEGMQAVLSSDFSIGQFRYLERLLLVHGRWSYLRMCKFLRYFFYKNFAFTLTHFWYSFFSGFSAQSVFDPVLISMYNLFFTALPVLVMGIFDQDVSDEYSLRFPRLYIPGQFNLFFNMRIFIYSIIHGMLSSLVLFFIPFGTLFHSVGAQGRDDNDYAMLAFTSYTALVLVVTGQVGFDTAYWTWLNWFVVLGSIAVYFLIVVVIYELLPIRWLYPYVSFWHAGVVSRAFGSVEFWLSLALVCAILLLPVLGNRFFWFDTHPSYADRLRVRHRLYKEAGGEERPTTSAKQMPRTAVGTRRQRRGSLRSGYAFSHSSGFGELIAKGTLFKNLEQLRIPSFRHGGHHSPRANGEPQHNTHRRFSLLRPLATAAAAFVPSGAPSSPLLLAPANLMANADGEAANGNGRSSTVTQFSPGSSNATTTTTLMSNSNGNSRQQTKSSMPSRRLGTVESLVIEHPPLEDSLDSPPPITEEEEEQPPMNSSRLRPKASAAVLVTMREPSPDLMNREHNLVVNADLEEGTPLPSNWRYNSDGTLFIPELEQPPQPGTPPAMQPTASKFVSKKRSLPANRSDSMASNGDGSTPSSSSQGQAQASKLSTVRLETPPPSSPGHRRSAYAVEAERQRARRVFTGKHRQRKGSDKEDTTATESSSSGGGARRSSSSAEAAAGAGQKQTANRWTTAGGEKPPEKPPRKTTSFGVERRPQQQPPAQSKSSRQRSRSRSRRPAQTQQRTEQHESDSTQL